MCVKVGLGCDDNFLSCLTLPPPRLSPSPPQNHAAARTTELEYLYFLVRSIDLDAFALPANTITTDAKGRMTYNPEFPGVKYPDKLSSYKSFKMSALSEDIPGKWGLVYDSFKQVATIRSMLFPGAFSYYSAVTNSAGRCYFGSGLKNKDLAFCV